MFLSKIKMLVLWPLFCLVELTTANAITPNYFENWNDSSAEPVNDLSLDGLSTSIYNENRDFNMQEKNITNAILYDAGMDYGDSPLDIMFTPSLVTIGVTGNVLSIYVFYKSKLRSQSMSQYLTALAVSDSVFLGQLLPPWLSNMQINRVFHQQGYCKGFVYVSYVTCCLSSWLVIAFTVERFVAVHYPLQRPSVCTVRRARYVILALSVGALIVNIPVIHFAGSGDDICNIDKDKLEQAAQFNWVDTTVVFTVPLILIIVLNTWIAITVWKLERERLKLTNQERRILSPWERAPRETDHLHRQRYQQRITNMLLIVSTVFVIFNCPAYTLRICGYTYDMTRPLYLVFAGRYRKSNTKHELVDSSELDDKWMMAQTVAIMMFNTNFGVNFFLYCLTGQNFRHALQQTVPCCGWLARKASAITNRSNRNHARTCSVTTSAASTCTDVTCMEMPFVMSNIRRRRRRSGNDVFRWMFDDSRQSRQRRAAAVSEASESLEMHEITPRPGTSLVITDERPRAEISHALSSRQGRPAIPTTRRTNQYRRPMLRLNRPAVEPTRPIIEPQCRVVDPIRNIIQPMRPMFDPMHPVIASRPRIIEPMGSSIESTRSGPGAEPRRRVLSRVTVDKKRKPPNTNRFMQLFRHNSAERRRQDAHLYD